MAFVSKKEADAYDRIMDAAAELFELIEQSGIRIGEDDLETLTIYLAQNAVAVKDILKTIKLPKASPPPSAASDADLPDEAGAMETDPGDQWDG